MIMILLGFSVERVAVCMPLPDDDFWGGGRGWGTRISSLLEISPGGRFVGISQPGLESGWQNFADPGRPRTRNSEA
eukprot:1962279-Rhodomonas_salina.1